MWFYDHVFDHPQAELRVLQTLELDGAAPLLSRMRPRDRDITLVTQVRDDTCASAYIIYPVRCKFEITFTEIFFFTILSQIKTIESVWGGERDRWDS